MDVVDLLINTLKLQKDKNIKAQILQTYISMFGAVPNERGDEVRQAMEDNE